MSPIEVWFAGFTSDGSRVVVAADSRSLSAPNETSYVTAGALSGSEAGLVPGGPAWWFPDMNASGTFVPSADPDGVWAIRATDSGDVVYRAPEGWSIHGVSWDGARAVINSSAALSPSGDCGPTRVVSTADDSFSAELTADGCTSRAIFSPDGQLVYAVIQGGENLVGVFDSESGELLVSISDHRCWGLSGAFTPDGSKFFLGNGPMCVFDPAALVSGGPIDDAVELEIAAHDALVLRVAVSADGSMAATASWSEPVRLWDLESGQLLGEFGVELEGRAIHNADLHPTLPYLLVTTPPNEVRIHTLDLDQLVAIAEARLSREMTEAECEQYFRRSCEES